ncbi:hypothetical protein MPH_02199 [Macrophomina phaseolina MS6]|uniref:Rhomboid family membrane protein n=2 Tax=Macrophomina phaseolina TaxID=35725 RepID=K2RD65_MACPH|nr:hypothetical protein MPH_02199 [Macrophomina phaseolina MS6]KAH7042099.1 hypothetical protein B0J12DRAFT_674702 [Macrophomina phaseolina]
MTSASGVPTAPPDVPAPSTETLPKADREGYAKLTHRLSIWLLIACPTIALLPPRKLDLYTFGLGGMSLIAAEHLARERTGRTILQRVGNGFDSAVQPADHLPTERARQVQEMQRRAKEEREALLRQSQAGATGHGEDKQQSALQRVWMGGESEGWRERRLKEEREAIEEGRGYGDLIMDQIWEVWNWGRGKAGKGEDGQDGSGKN